MSLDLFLRSENLATLRSVIASVTFRGFIGDIRARDEVGDLIPNRLRQLPGSVDLKYFPSSSVVIEREVIDEFGTILSPAVNDSWSWLHLRLSGPAESSDFEDDPVDSEPDRWDKSRIRRWMKDNGVFKRVRGIRVYEHTLGNGKRVQIWRGKEMADAGVLFHEFLGGNVY